MYKKWCILLIACIPCCNAESLCTILVQIERIIFELPEKPPFMLHWSQKGMVLNWISRVIGDYFWLFNMGFWFWWLLHILACTIHHVEASNLNIFVKNFPKMGKIWQKSGHEKYFHTYWRMVMGSHQNPVFMTSHDHPFSFSL